jgi:hypothetical protein
VLNLSRGKSISSSCVFIVDKDNYESALKWCDYIILDEEINHPMDDRMVNKVARRLSTPREELLQRMRGDEERG